MQLSPLLELPLAKGLPTYDKGPSHIALCPYCFGFAIILI